MWGKHGNNSKPAYYKTGCHDDMPLFQLVLKVSPGNVGYVQCYNRFVLAQNL